MPEKDYKIILKIKNNRLLSLIKKAGYSRIRDFCRAAGIQLVTVYSLINFKKSPINKRTGKWTKIASEISYFLGELPDYVFPEYMQRVFNGCSERCLSHGQMLSMAEELSQQIESAAFKKNLLNQLATVLTSKEAWVIQKRYAEDKTVRQCGATMGVSQNRILQIECKALRKLRNKAKDLKVNPQDFF